MDFIPQGAIGNKPLGYAQITNLTAAVPLPAIPAGTQTVVVVCSGQSVRFRDDGTAPTATIGFPLPVNQYYEFMLANHAALQFIEVAASATLDILYYGR